MQCLKFYHCVNREKVQHGWNQKQNALNVSQTCYQCCQSTVLWLVEIGWVPHVLPCTCNQFLVSHRYFLQEGNDNPTWSENSAQESLFLPIIFVSFLMCRSRVSLKRMSMTSSNKVKDKGKLVIAIFWMVDVHVHSFDSFNSFQMSKHGAMNMFLVKFSSQNVSVFATRVTQKKTQSSSPRVISMSSKCGNHFLLGVVPLWKEAFNWLQRLLRAILLESNTCL